MTDHKAKAESIANVRNLLSGYSAKIEKDERFNDDEREEFAHMVQSLKDVEKTHMEKHEEAHAPTAKEREQMDTPSKVDEPEAIAVLNAEAMRSPAGVIDKAEKPGGQDANSASSFVSNPSLGEARKEAENAVHETPANPAKLGDDLPQVNQTEDELKPEADKVALPLAKKAATKITDDSKETGEAIQKSESQAKADVAQEGEEKLIGSKGGKKL